MEPLRRAFRGYEPAQVDRLISGLYSQLEARLREIEEQRLQNVRLTDEVSSLMARADRLESDERAVQNALVSAHRQADEVLAEARKEAETLLQVAREASARYQEDLRGRIDDLNWQIERLTLQKQRFTGSFRELLESNLSQLAEGVEAASPEPRSLAPADPAPEQDSHPSGEETTNEEAERPSPVEVG